jgi:hypothetical protein
MQYAEQYGKFGRINPKHPPQNWQTRLVLGGFGFDCHMGDAPSVVEAYCGVGILNATAPHDSKTDESNWLVVS